MHEVFWASLEERRGVPEALARRRREFLEPLPIVDDSVAADEGADRRDFLKLMGFSLSVAGLGACTRAPVEEAIPFVQLPEGETPGTALYYATTCGACTAGCGLLVKARDGRPIKIEGNSGSPLTSGGTCAVGQASVLSLYDGQRLRGPLWRGEPVPWQEVDRRIRGHLSAVAETSGRTAVVTGSLTSPSTRRLLADWTRRFPGSRVVPLDAVSLSAVRRANEACFGRAVIPRYRFDRARTVIGLDADFLGTWLSPVEHARGYTSRHQPRKPSAMSRHFHFEPGLSLTGANADRRVPVEATDLGLVALHLLDRLGQRAGVPSLGDLAALPATVTAALDEGAEALWASRGASLVVSGPNAVALQVVTNAINHLLGNLGRTIDLDQPSHQRQGDEAAFEGLVADMERGEIQALILHGVNPGYHHPQAERFLTALDRVALSVSLSDRLDETSSHTDAVCPVHHYLESWNDAEPVAGLLALAQPAIAPLFDTRSAVESLLAWMGEPQTHLRFLREHWRREIFPRQQRWSGFDRFWDHTLQDGFLILPAEPASEPPFRGDLAAAVAAITGATREGRSRRARGAFDLALYEKVGLRDGGPANNPWLQELPDPVTRVTWGNYAVLAPSTAEELGVEQEDVVRLEGEGGAPVLELPVLVQPGQAPRTVSVALGYGRRKAGKVGDGVGGDAYPWVSLVDGVLGYTASGVAVQPVGRRETLAATQLHHTMEGRDIVRETTWAEYRRNPAAGNEEHPPLPDLWAPRKEIQHAWGLAIDLNACTGCAACVIACQAENNVPVVGKDEVRRSREMHWLRIDRYYKGPEEEPQTVFQPLMCQHCDHAPCETVCPVLATVHSSDGLNQQIYNRCIGTRYCANNCPYKVRRFNWFQYAGNDSFDFTMDDSLAEMVLNPDVVVRSRGVMEKCSLCIQRIQAGKLRAEIAGRRVEDGDIETACQQACPSEAIVFGDLLDEDSRVARSSRDPGFYHVLEEIGTRPSVGYLTRVRNLGKT